AVHIGPNGQPDHVVIRGVTPSGDAQENFVVNDREARWKSPVDSGASAYDNRAHYVPYGGTMSSIAVLAEKLYAAPERKLPLLPKGEARLERLVSVSVGAGATQQTVTAYAIDGLSLSPLPVWLDSQAKFFALVNPGASLSVMPEGYAGGLSKLQSSQT